MLAKKNSFSGIILFIALAFFLAGCTPAGPRALLKGKKCLDRADYAGAVAQLKTATTLLVTNAAAWNYYGVALQGDGHPEEAATAYQTALKLDRDLVEAHFNLGGLCLEQNKAETAQTEFTAYTLHRPNDEAGWLKLGSAQLKLGETAPAERSFSTVYHMDGTSPEALNGLGLARIQGGKPQDAAKFFAAAVKARPDYAPAILNLATVHDQYLHDNKAALENYRAYLALKNRPPNWAEVNELASNLEAAEARTVAATQPAEKPTPPPVAEVKEVKAPPRVSNVITQRLVLMTKPQPMAKATSQVPAPMKSLPMQYVEVKPETPIFTTPRAAPTTTLPARAPPAVKTPSLDATMSMEAPTQLEVPMPEEQPKKSFWGKIFGGRSKQETEGNAKYLGENLTPLPGNSASFPETKPVVVPAARPLVVVPPVPVFARYNYFSPRKPLAGDRTMASGAFTEARLFEQDEKWSYALKSYQQAAAFDPSWFEAQYNAGVIAHRLRDYSVALPRYEMALAVQPGSTDARYNFALALKAAGYAPDAAEQLKIILAGNPRQVRAHLALANICAQSLRDTPQAREHYLKVLELDPGNPQTSDIRFWLSANPP